MPAAAELLAHTHPNGGGVRASQGARGTGGGHLRKARCLGGVFFSGGLLFVVPVRFLGLQLKTLANSRCLPCVAVEGV